MTLSLPSLELPGIVLVGVICFIAGAAVGSALMANTIRREGRKARG